MLYQTKKSCAYKCSIFYTTIFVTISRQSSQNWQVCKGLKSAAKQCAIIKAWSTLKNFCKISQQQSTIYEKAIPLTSYLPWMTGPQILVQLSWPKPYQHALQMVKHPLLMYLALSQFQPVIKQCFLETKHESGKDLYKWNLIDNFLLQELVPSYQLVWFVV